MMKNMKRGISFLLCMTMLLSYIPVISFATEADGLCPHHETHAECGYVEGEADCGFVCADCAAVPEETTEPPEATEPEATTEPEEVTEPVCTGLADCPAESHGDGCEKKLADEKTADDKVAADTVAALIEALPALEEVQEKPMAEQREDYEQVQTVYGAYCALSADQQAFLPPAEEVFKPYFDYFNSLVSLIWSGSGTASQPFLIYTEQELCDLAQQVTSGNTYSGVYFRLVNSIALTGTWTPIGTETYKFCGTFDGNGKTISGLSATGDYIGLFNYVGAGAVIKNLNLTEVSMRGEYYVAGLAAYVDAASGSVTISNCHVSGSVYAQGKDEDGDTYGSYAGGIAAYVDATKGNVTIENCSMSGTSDGDTNVGGIIGCGKSSGHKLMLKHCINRAGIPTGSNSDSCGGIAGSLSSAVLEGCINYGNVSGNAYSEDNGSSWLGGITGYGSGCTFNGCANYGAISTFFAGGITASQAGGNVANSCLNAGKLTHSSDGFGYGLLYASNTTNIATNSYYRYGTGMTGAEYISESQLTSGEIAYALREYFGQNIGEDTYPVLLTATNRVYRVMVVGELNATYYVNYGDTIAFPELSSCAAYFNGDSKFDTSAPITQDYALAAKGYHNYVDGACSYCGNEGVNYLDVGICGDSVAWTLTEDGTLTISGSGAMTNYSAATPAPWIDYASSIKSVEIGKGVTRVGNHAFKGLTNVSSVSMADTVTAIGEYAFNGLSGLTTVTIGNSVTDIGSYAFASCTALNSLTLGSQLKTIGDYAFYQCEGLTYVSVPASVTTLGSGAFRGCTALERITLSTGLKTIGSYALSETGLDYHTVPETVETIGDYAYANCSALVDVTFLGTAPQIGASAFSGDTVACHVPNYDSSWASNVQKNFGGTLTWSMGSGTCGNTLNWVLDFNKKLTISGTGTMQNFYMSYGVSSAPWSSLRQQIQSVVISDGVTSIGDYAFAGCSNLTSVTIADSVTKIGTVSNYTGYGCSFMDCTSLTQITIPKNVTSIGYSTFYGCSSLTTIEVASGNTAYSSANGILYDRYKDAIHCYPAGKTGAFTIPSTVDKIMPYAFVTCKDLTEVTIPSTVTSIGNYAFGYCYGLNHITFMGSAPTFGSYSFVGVTATVDYPTADTTWTHSVMKSAGGTALTWNAGSGSCGTGVQWTLTYTYSTVTLTISGSGAMDDYTTDTLPWAAHIANITTFEVCDGVTSVGAYALCMGTSSAADTSLTTVTLADSVTSIGDDAFLFCTKLRNLTLGNGIKTIGDSAFINAPLTSINFPDSLQSIGEYAFEYCTSLKSITFGNNLQTIGYTAFAGCTALQTVDLGSSVTTLDQSAFSGCSSLTKITIPASVTSIGKWAFRNCTKLQYIEFLGDAPTITSYAFQGVTSNAYYLSSKSGWTSSNLLNYGGTLTWGALSQHGTCGTNAEWILDTSGNLYICGSGAMAAYSESNKAPWYNYRSSIKKVSLNGMTTIGAYAFSGCTAITEVLVPSTITSIGTYAFADCTDLQVVIFDGNAPSFGTNAFSGTTCEMWYPSTASKWTSSVCTDYGGTLTWRCTTSSGTCSTTAKTRWAFDTTNTLVILGTGIMPTYSSSYRPWYSFRTEIQSVVIGNKVTSITDGAFSGCTALQTVTIGTGVTSITYNAFSSCTALTEVTFLGKAPSTISYNAFNGVTATVYYPMNDTSWTTSKMTNYGGTLTWVAVCPGHIEVAISAVAPTCTTTGLTEGSYCSLCKEVLIAQEVVPANGHYAMGPDGTEVPADTLEPDCTTSIVCTVCSAVAKDALGHRIIETESTETNPLTITNASSTPFTLTSGTYYSTNTAHSSSSDLVITAQHECSLTLNYGVSSEKNYDKLLILLNGYQKNAISGEVTNQTLTLELNAGDVVTVRYKKDGSVSNGSDKGWVTLVYDNVMVESAVDVPAETGEPDCTNGVVCAYCQTVVKEALGHRVIVALPEPEVPYEVSSTSAYPFELTDGTYYSTNAGKSSTTSTLQITAKSACTLTLSYGVSSEATYDYLSIFLNEQSLQKISGTVSGTRTLNLTSGDVITVSYTKDSSVNRNEDRGWISVQFDKGPTEEIVPADSVEAGCNDIICYFCQAVAKEGLGHTWDEGIVTTPATCTTDGQTVYTCTAENCGQTDERTVSATHGTAVYHPAVGATTETAGNSEYWSCPDCQLLYLDEALTEETTLEAVTISKKTAVYVQTLIGGETEKKVTVGDETAPTVSFVLKDAEGNVLDVTLESEAIIITNTETKETVSDLETAMQTPGTYTITLENPTLSDSNYTIVEINAATLLVEEAGKTYAIGMQIDIRLHEPWAVRAYGNIYPVVDGILQAMLTQEEVEKLDYGVYFLRSSDTDKTLSELTIEDFTANTSAYHYSKNDANRPMYAQESGSIVAEFAEGIYADQLSEPIYTLYYVVDNDVVSYSSIKERNLIETLKDFIDKGQEEEKVLNAYSALVNFEEKFITYIGNDKGKRAELQDAPTLAEYSLPTDYKVYNVNPPTGKYFSYTNSIALVEPWSLKLDAYVNNDSTEYQEYGFVVYYDKDNKYNGAEISVEQLLSEQNAYVFSTKNGDVEISKDATGRAMYTAIYNKDIYSYQLDKTAYVMFYVFDGVDYHYGPVKARVIMGIMDETYNNMSESGQAVFDAMKGIYTAIVDYRK